MPDAATHTVQMDLIRHEDLTGVIACVSAPIEWRQSSPLKKGGASPD
jgi:hypothetical protein